MCIVYVCRRNNMHGLHVMVMINVNTNTVYNITILLIHTVHQHC